MMEPLTRQEAFMFALAGLTDSYPEPITRKEKILAAMIDRLAKIEAKDAKKKKKEDKA